MMSALRRPIYRTGVFSILLMTAISAAPIPESHAFAAFQDPSPAATQESVGNNNEELLKIIIEKIYEAYGGRERISGIRDSKSLAYNKILPQGQAIKTASCVKLPDKMRVDMEGMETMMFDGKTGWMVHPLRGSVQKMPENVLVDFKRSSWAAQGMLNPEIMNVPPKLEGRALIEGKNYIVISYADCGEFDSVHVYVDPDTYLPYLFAYSSPGVRIQAIHSDYRDVDGMKVPFSIKTDLNGTKFIALTMIEFKFNAGLDDSLFTEKSLKSRKGLLLPEDPSSPIEAVPEPEPVRKVEPVYPELARRARVSGDVILEITIDKEGSVRDARVAEGYPMLNDAAIRTVKQWKYRPTIRDGKPVPVITTVKVKFRP